MLPITEILKDLLSANGQFGLLYKLITFSAKEKKRGGREGRRTRETFLTRGLIIISVILMKAVTIGFVITYMSSFV